MRRFDFDPEAVVRLAWRGVRAINVATPVRYFGAAEGGVSHFCYVRDNLRLAAMHARLLVGVLRRFPGPISSQGKEVSASFCKQKEAKKLF